MKTWTEKAERRKQEIDNLEQFKTIVKSKKYVKISAGDELWKKLLCYVRLKLIFF